MKEIERIKGKIEFKNLTFRYPGGEYDVLKNVSFVINPGERVGIVGKTGAGKTTLVDLILRTYNVKDGALFIDDQDVNDRRSIRSGRAVPMCLRTASFFPIPSSETSAFPSMRRTRVRWSWLRKWRTSTKISLISRMVTETIPGERGVTVSGGQKQRISIAGL